jgi:ribosomal protein S17E
MKIRYALLACVLFSFPVAAKMYKWVDDKGTTHYGETVPPEYAGRDRAELDQTGRVIEKKTAQTAEERRSAEQAEAKKRVDDETALEHKRRDRALLNTYSNEKEIDLARNRNLQQQASRIDSINSQLKTIENKIAGLKREADSDKSSGKPIPPSLLDDLNESQSRLAKMQQDLDKAKSEKAVIDARYDADKARYKELTGK